MAPPAGRSARRRPRLRGRDRPDRRLGARRAGSPRAPAPLPARLGRGARARRAGHPPRGRRRGGARVGGAGPRAPPVVDPGPRVPALRGRGPRRRPAGLAPVDPARAGVSLGSGGGPPRARRPLGGARPARSVRGHPVRRRVPEPPARLPPGSARARGRDARRRPVLRPGPGDVSLRRRRGGDLARGARRGRRPAPVPLRDGGVRARRARRGHVRPDADRQDARGARRRRHEPPPAGDTSSLAPGASRGRGLGRGGSAAPAPIRIAVLLDGEEIGAAELPGTGWSRFRIDMARSAGQSRAISLVLTSPGRLSLCLDALVLP